MKTEVIKSFSRDFYWVVPFALFLAGYQLFNLVYKTHRIKTPLLVGQTLQRSMSILAQSKLNARLIRQKEDPDLQEGTILNQIPSAGQLIKPHQTIFLVVSRHPQRENTPLLKGKFNKDCIDILRKRKIRYHAFSLQAPQPKDLCIAQIPEPDQPLSTDGVTIYFAADSNADVIFPDFVGYSVHEVSQFLAEYGIKPQIFHLNRSVENHSCSGCIIKEQRPLAGSFVNLKTPFLVQLKV